MYPNEYDFDVELSQNFYEDELDAPDAPENWELDDFNDLLGVDNETWH